MQSVSSRIWTHVAVSIFYDDNHYTTGTFPNGFCPKVNVIAWLEFELAYFDSYPSALTITLRIHPLLFML